MNNTSYSRKKTSILLWTGIIAVLVLGWVILTDPFPSQEEQRLIKQQSSAIETFHLVDEFVSEFRKRPNVSLSVYVTSFWGLKCSYDEIEKTIAPYAHRQNNRALSVWYESQSEIADRLGEAPYQNLVLVRFNVPNWITDYPDHEQRYKEVFQEICATFPFEKSKYPIVFYMYYGPSIADGV